MFGPKSKPKPTLILSLSAVRQVLAHRRLVFHLRTCGDAVVVAAALIDDEHEAGGHVLLPYMRTYDYFHYIDAHDVGDI